MKIFLTVIVFFAPIICVGQMKIEDIKVDEDVIQFVSEYGQKYSKDWRKVSFNDLNGMFSQNNRKKSDLFFLDSLTKRKWIKSDFNKDGKLDLIFSGRIHTQLAVLAFMSNGDSIECNYLGNSIAMYYPSGISKLKINETNLLLINSFVRNDMQYEIASSYKADTLIYKLGGFIELSKSHKNSIEFDSIIFKTLSPWMGLVEIPKMKILSNGSIILYRNSGTYLRDSALWINGMRETWVSKEVMSDLKSILGYISFGELNTDYETKYVYDLSTAITEVYHKGEMKSVRDYGWHGTYGLSLLYKKLNEAKLMSLRKPAQ